MLAGAYFDRTRNISFIQNIWPNIKRALAWMDNYGDRDQDGFIEYEKRSVHGLVQQGWKDSFDRCSMLMGGWRGPRSLCVKCKPMPTPRGVPRHGSLGRSAKLIWPLNAKLLPIRCRNDSRAPSGAMNSEATCSPSMGKRKCVVNTSNAGHTLFCGIASRRHAESVGSGLLREQLFSGWGVRTVSSSEKRYNPMSYHDGSVWPHDNAIVAMGLSKYRMQHYASQIFQGFYEVSRHMELQRLPELFCGFHKREDGSGPTLYPVACAPQAWAAGSVFLLLQACLAVRVECSDRPQISFSQPSFPEAFQSVRIENLQLGDASVGLILQRNERGVSVEITQQQGDIEVTSD